MNHMSCNIDVFCANYMYRYMIMVQISIQNARTARICQHLFRVISCPMLHSTAHRLVGLVLWICR